MTERERRGASRTEISPDLEIHLIVEIHHQPILARVCNMSRRGLCVESSDPAIAMLTPKTQLSDSFLGTPEQHGYRLPSLSVVEVVIGQIGQAIVHLSADDAATKSALWSAIVRLEEGRDIVPLTLPPGESPKLPKIPGRGKYSETARLERLAWTREISKAPLQSFENTRLDPERLSGNLENMIGSVEVPVGIAGPLLMHGNHARGLTYAPLATTEGALIASVSRGALAISESGGVTVQVLGQRMMRAPMFLLATLESAFLFARWIHDHKEEATAEVAKVSRRGKLVAIEPSILGRMVHVHFVYETSDAAGQNMTTACTWQVCQWILRNAQKIPGISIEHFLIEANLSGDKKVNYRSFILGRGIRVVAEARIRAAVLERVLKVSSTQLVRAVGLATHGSIQSGMVGHNFNVANVIAAMFTATGQDIACVHESSVAQLQVHPEGDDVYLSLVLPSLVIGTVGGGTHLPGQRDALEMMGCAGGGKVMRLAEIIAGFCLALDLSTASAATSGEFATAHERLGRNRPVEHFTTSDLRAALFEDKFRQNLNDPTLQIESIDGLPKLSGDSFVAEISGRKIDKLLGHLPLRIHYNSSSSGSVVGHAVDVVVKVKPLDRELLHVLGQMVGLSGERLSYAYRGAAQHLGFVQSHERELAICEQRDPRFVAHSPLCYATIRNEAREAYVLVLEHIGALSHMNSANYPERWEPFHIETALRGLAELHSIWLGRREELESQSWLGARPNPQTLSALAQFWEAAAHHAAQEFFDLVPATDLDLRLRLIRTLSDWSGDFWNRPLTLIHGDFSPRNIALRVVGSNGEMRLCAYDWELATLAPPQRDLAEFLAYVLPPNATEEMVTHWLRYFQSALEKSSGQSFDAAEFRRGYHLSLRHFYLHTLGLYLVAHTFRHYDFLPRLASVTRRLLALEGDL